MILLFVYYAEGSYCHTLVKVEFEVETRVGFIIRKKTTADAADATSGPLIFL